MTLNKQDILGAQDLGADTVQVPEWGGEVLVARLTGLQRDRFEGSLVKGKKVDVVNIRARFCALCIVDGNGNRIFTDADAEALGEKSAAALSRVYNAAAEINGMTDSDVEELAKNSGAIQEDEQPSD